MKYLTLKTCLTFLTLLFAASAMATSITVIKQAPTAITVSTNSNGVTTLVFPGPQGAQGAAGVAGADSTVPGPQGPPGETGAAGTTDHTLLTNIGTNAHSAIDTALSRLANTSGTNTGDQDLTGLVHTNRTALDLVSGTNTGDQDLSGLVVSGGKAGGQTINGGTAAGENLSLSSTGNATKGKIFLGSNSVYDDVNKRLGIGSTSPSAKLHVVATLPTGGAHGVKVSSTGAGSTGAQYGEFIELLPGHTGPDSYGFGAINTSLNTGVDMYDGSDGYSYRIAGGSAGGVWNIRNHHYWPADRINGRRCWRQSEYRCFRLCDLR